jgi:hypothetical protein
MVDPIGTGWSRATKPEYVKEFAIIVGDVMAEAEFIRSWLYLHDAEDAPIFVAGESFGSGRAGRVGAVLQKKSLNLAGIMLISGRHRSCWVREFQSRRLGDARRRHGGRRLVLQKDTARARHDARTGPTVTEKWVRERYLPLVLRLDSLSGRRKGAARVRGLATHGLSGRDGSTSRGPIISSQGWFGAFPVDGKRAITSDYRRNVAAPKTWMPAALRYLRRDLGYRTDLPYSRLRRRRNARAGLCAEWKVSRDDEQAVGSFDGLRSDARAIREGA